MNLEEIKRDLISIKDRDVLIFGSLLSGEWRENSDIDIAILSYQYEKEIFKKLKMEVLRKVPQKYDISIFESLPVVVKASILQNYQVLFGNPLKIGEYLRKYWKQWQDYGHRLEHPSLEEMRENIVRNVMKRISRTE